MYIEVIYCFEFIISILLSFKIFQTTFNELQLFEGIIVHAHRLVCLESLLFDFVKTYF